MDTDKVERSDPKNIKKTVHNVLLEDRNQKIAYRPLCLTWSLHKKGLFEAGVHEKPTF